MAKLVQYPASDELNDCGTFKMHHRRHVETKPSASGRFLEFIEKIAILAQFGKTFALFWRLQRIALLSQFILHLLVKYKTCKLERDF